MPSNTIAAGRQPGAVDVPGEARQATHRMVLERFADQASRRLTGLLAGVKPPTLDTGRNRP